MQTTDQLLFDQSPNTSPVLAWLIHIVNGALPAPVVLEQCPVSAKKVMWEGTED